MKAIVSAAQLKKVVANYSETDQSRIAAADEFAARAHHGQKRKSGQPYITHPRAVASYLAQMGLDAETVITGLLHDTVEDTSTTLEDIHSNFGASVATLVDGVTRLGQVDYVHVSSAAANRHASSIENIRKLLLAMSKDVRVVMIKLADRRHNLQTLHFLKPEDRKRIANESLDVFAPLADRLGMGVLKAEIEDLAFEYANPEAYNLVRRLVAGSVEQTKTYMDELSHQVDHLLKENNIQAESIHGREKHLYSIYRKLAKTDGDISKIYDLTALRIIVPTVSDCYQTLGIIHQHYKPLIYRIKDYIAVPKPNGYRSLHTTVIIGEGRIMEIQIRTPEMHEEAEQGLASHAIYNIHKDTKRYKRGTISNVDKKLQWIQDLAGVSAMADPEPDYMKNLSIDLFQDRIFVFSPKGDLYDLPERATPIDFAFAVHTDVGLRTQGARVNGKLVPLDRALENRDMVDIITRKTPAPNRQWLHIVKTASARNKIRAWFRAQSREASTASGESMLEAALAQSQFKRVEDIPVDSVKKALDSFNYKDIGTLFAAIGDGMVSAESALRRLLPRGPKSPKPENTTTAPPPKGQKTTGRIQVLGAPGLPCTPAACCNPTPPDSLTGYITRGSGITVHRAGCGNIPDEPDRLLRCQWEVEQKATPELTTTLQLRCLNRVGLVHDITGVISRRDIDIVKITTRSKNHKDQFAMLEFRVAAPDPYSLSALVDELKGRPDVIGVSTRPAKKSVK
jgi:GTP diphosphokinase / guanosine-3',5'-bis(diphosphate) 3'-diphosphatase